ncbi:cytochrome P450 2G1-like [Discoglossus pictus]
MEEKEPPPGPTLLPILGNILQITPGGMVKSLMKLREKYGDVYTVYMGSRPVVVVTGYKTVKEILVDRGDDFLARETTGPSSSLQLFQFQYFYVSRLIFSSTFTFLSLEKNNPNREYTMTNLSFSTLQIFFAGVDTISTTLTYSLLILMKHSDVLGKQLNYTIVHVEIDRVIGGNRHPNLQDRSPMPYTDAVMYDIQRYVDLIPMGLPMKTPYDVKFRGYTIPKDTNVFPMLTSVLRDPSCFPYPDEFNPKNFLDQNGELKKNNGLIIIWDLIYLIYRVNKKRVCLGEAFVRMELFLLFITILQNFDLKSPVPLEDLDLAPEVAGLGNFPKPYKVSFVIWV